MGVIKRGAFERQQYQVSYGDATTLKGIYETNSYVKALFILLFYYKLDGDIVTWKELLNKGKRDYEI